MTKEEISRYYTDTMFKKAEEYVESIIGREKSFLPSDAYNEMHDIIFNAFAAGADCCKDVTLEIHKLQTT